MIKSTEALSEKLTNKQREMRQLLKRLARTKNTDAQRTVLHDLLENLNEEIDSLQKQLQIQGGGS